MFSPDNLDLCVTSNINLGPTVSSHLLLPEEVKMAIKGGKSPQQLPT